MRELRESEGHQENPGLEGRQSLEGERAKQRPQSASSQGGQSRGPAGEQSHGQPDRQREAQTWESGSGAQGCCCHSEAAFPGLPCFVPGLPWLLDRGQTGGLPGTGRAVMLLGAAGEC